MNILLIYVVRQFLYAYKVKKILKEEKKRRGCRIKKYSEVRVVMVLRRKRQRRKREEKR
jgi:hypothetical protein